jgi:hypothetical protein
LLRLVTVVLESDTRLIVDGLLDSMYLAKQHKYSLITDICLVLSRLPITIYWDLTQSNVLSKATIKGLLKSLTESSLFGLQNWLAPARIGLFRAWAWIWVASPAHARHFGLQASLLAWQAIPPVDHRQSGLRSLRATSAWNVGSSMVNELVYILCRYLGNRLKQNSNIG